MNFVKWPFTGAILQSTSPSNPPARPPTMAAQGTRPGYADGWSVGRCGIKFLMLFRCANSFTWATRIPSSGQLYAAFR